ncbi:S-adenosyl-L-methionine-dependent methyltransferase [Penicillium angulare]|uniref:S-adenosyl-L-methionine-dependent methyltransferase n=1 Tax=Penicillium angulare TaxID=116970 RepID=UPI0025400889|nr:S-adenosyl-L-methionine-dependent methyltransferase [Penicillium angulare]KAJ5256893.1 S-adenosyl-L-methionine-dependent methyltransferase [Penicillium angulare]
MAGASEKATYTHGHHASVLRSHSTRTALNSASFLLPHLKPDMKILDIGCGPGTITVDLATYVPQGHVTGLERVDDVLPKAQALADERGIKNIEFVVGDGNGLAYSDDSFDVVFCHQVLQHVADPVGMLTEMKRVAKKGGIVAAREADYSVFMWFPEIEGLRDWQTLYDKVARNNGGEPNAGRFLHSWARKAGLEDKRHSVSSWCFGQKDEVEWWSETWQERSLKSSFATTALAAELATSEELENISKCWKQWGEDVDAFISIPSAEIICFK